VVHGRTVYEANDGNPVNNLSRTFKTKKNKISSFPHVFSGEVVHGRTVYGAKDANPVKQFSKLLYIMKVYKTSSDITPA
jgi:hypothetical protein